MLLSAVRQRDAGTLQALLSQGSENTNGLQTSSATESSPRAPVPPTPGGGSSLGRSPGTYFAMGMAKTRKAVDQNERDSSGNSALHLAVTMGSLGLVQTLLSLAPKLNVNFQDFESGYTALHKALYAGYLSIALEILRARGSEIDLGLRDAEGNSCLDLLNSTIEHPVEPKRAMIREKSWTNDFDDDSGPEEADEDSGFEATEKSTRRHVLEHCASFSVWSWGSNSNYSLGHRNSDDRAYPERLDFNHNSSPTSSTAPLKASIHTVFDFYPDLDQVAISKYHSCVLAEGRLHVCGFGKDGRLGLGHEETVLQLTSLDLESEQRVAFVAVGPDHTVALTVRGRVWTWGSNAFGQLGYIVEANSQDPGKELVPREVSNGLKKICVLGAAASKFHTAVFTEDGFVFTWGTNKGQLGYSSTTQWTPRKITRFPRQPILQIAATNSATALLTGSNEVYVFSDNEYTKVHFQFGLNLPPGMKLAKKSPGPKSIERIVAGHHQFAILSSDGDVHMWVSPSREFAKAWEQAALSQQAPKCIWRAKKGFLRATDVSIGIDSSVIMTTASGHVFIGKRRSGNSKTKIHDSNLTDSRLFKFTKVPFLHHITKVAASSAGALFAIRKDIRRRAPDLEPSTFRDDIKALLDASLSSSVQSDRFMDVCFHGARQSEIWAHSGILACRSPFLRTLLNNSSTDEKHRISVKRLDSAFHITIDQFHRDSISLVLEYIYAGTFRRSWDSSVLLYKGKEQDLDTDGNPTKAKLYQDFNQLVKLFELDDSQLILYQSSSLLSQKYKESFASLLEESSHKDVIIQLKDTEIACHQFILVSRSKFFKALLGPGSHWTVSQDENIKAFVQLSHVDSSIFHVVLAWMYGETDVIKLFGEIDTLSMRLLLQHFIDILAVADELLLDELKHICTQMLSSLIHIGNVLDLLLVSIMRDAEKLKHNCLDFICWNLETFISTNSLLDMDPVALLEIEAHLKAMQANKFPATRGPEGYYSRIKALSIAAENDRKQRRKQEIEEIKARGLSVDSDLPLLPPIPQRTPKKMSSSQSFAMSQHEDDFEYVTQKSSATTTPRKPRTFSNPSKDDIFEMELEEQTSPLLLSTPVKSKNKAWRKFSLTSPELRPQALEHPSPGTSPGWSLSASQEKSRVSLRNVMSQQNTGGNAGRPPLLRSPGLPPTSIPMVNRPHPVGSPTAHVSRSPFALEEPLTHLKISTGKQSQKERKMSRKHSITSPSSSFQSQPPVAWTGTSSLRSPSSAARLSSASPSSADTPKKSFREIIQQEQAAIFQREAVHSFSRPSLLASPSGTWAQSARAKEAPNPLIGGAHSISPIHHQHHPSPTSRFQKVEPPPPNSLPKKSLLEIQREEERKHKIVYKTQ